MFNLDNFVKGANTLGTSLGGQAGSAIQSIGGIVQGVRNIGKIVSKKIPKGAESSTSTTRTEAQFANATLKDWRVSLSIPTGSYEKSRILAPLLATGKFIFPFTPQVSLSHQATYSALEPIHNNYAFSSYENSKLDKITIQGDFYCENSDDAKYWIASVHFLRSVTKMYFGEKSENAGAPPPVLKLNGYGDYVFNDVPVVVTNFQVEMPNDVDYIPSIFAGSILADGGGELDTSGVGYVPVKSVLSVTLMPVYSRTAVREFNLQDFVKGNYVFTKGFI